MAQESDLALGRRTHPLSFALQGVFWGAAAAAAVFGTVVSGDLSPFSLLVVPIGFLLGFGAGAASWWFTRYVVDETEFRVDRGIVAKQSRKVSFERIQSVDIAEPFIARLVGLAELRIESAGGGESHTSLKYLPLDEAKRLRTLLLNRAHGTHTGPDIETERSRSVITQVPPGWLIRATLLSLDFVGAVVIAVAGLIVTVAFGYWWIALTFLVPTGTWLVQIIGTRVIRDWDFTLSDGERGLRIERGLLARSSQTIPFGRVQGVRVEEPFVWRRLGWSRLKVDVAGYSGESDGDESQSMLLPIGGVGVIAQVIERLIPGGEAEPHLALSPPTRLFAPIGWRYRSIGRTRTAAFSRTGWVYRTTDLVPHAKVQSVALTQGPVQRAFGVSTLQIHTPDGPVNAVGRHMALAGAGQFAFDELERARIARSAARDPDLGAGVHEVDIPSVQPAAGQNDLLR